MQIQELMGSYREQQVADGRSPFTIAQTERFTRMFVRWLSTVGHDGDVTRIDHALVARFFASDTVRLTNDGRPRKPGSANAIRSSLKCFLGYLAAIGATPRNAGALIRRARCGAPLPRALPEDDVVRLRAALGEARTDAERRDRVLFELMLSAGMRIGSATQQRIEDLDLDRGEARVVHAKGSREQRVVLPPALVDLLREFVGTRRSGWLFEGAAGGPLGTRQAARRLTWWSERAGLSRRAHPHALRHRYGCSIYERTNDLNLTRVALGHASIASTQGYVAVAMQRLRSAVAG